MLTSRQKRILDCIAESLDSRGYPPSVREIGEAVGLTSTAATHYQLGVLEREGYIRRDPYKARAITLSEPPSDSLTLQF